MTDTDVAAGELVALDDLEMLDSVGSAALVDLARSGATGELVCACPRGEGRVYLQAGRIAWANDCHHPRAFTAYLREHAGVDGGAIEEVVAACRATGKPMGESLLERGVATAEQILAALRHQARLALHIGSCRWDGRSTFQPRRYAPYDARFTFDAAEVLGDEDRPGDG